MGISVVLGPTEEPLSLSEAKAHCRIDSTDDDGLIAGYILAARKHVEGQIRRPICSRLYSYTIDYGWPWNYLIELPFPPLQAVRSITYVDTDGATQTLSSGLYTVLTDRPFGQILPSYNASWPSVREVVSAVTVRFIAGYTAFTDTTTSPNYSVSGETVPDDLRNAIMMLVSHWNENREAITVMAGTAPLDVPYGVEALISQYRAYSL